MKEFYETWETERGVEVVAVTLFDGETVGRGVAVCSPDDEPEEVVGSVTAYNYAKRAMLGRGNVFVTDRRAGAVLARTKCPYFAHSWRNAHLSWGEAKCFFGDDVEATQTGKFGMLWEHK